MKNVRGFNAAAAAVLSLPIQARVQILTDTVGEIARSIAVESFQNTISRIIGSAEQTGTNLAGEQTNTAPTQSNHRGRVKGSKNKPKATETQTPAPTTETASAPSEGASEKRTRPTKGNRVSDHIHRVLVNAGTQLDIAAITERLTKSEGFSTRSTELKKQQGMVRTYLNGLVKDGLVENVGHGVYKAKVVQNANPVAAAANAA